MAFIRRPKIPIFMISGMLLSCFGCFVIMFANFTFDYTDEIEYISGNLSHMFSKKNQHNFLAVCRPDKNVSNGKNSKCYPVQRTLIFFIKNVINKF